MSKREEDAKIYVHPNHGPMGAGKTHVYGWKIEPGETLEATDVYSSSSGYWEACPCPGLVLQEGNAVVWVRPA